MTELIKSGNKAYLEDVPAVVLRTCRGPFNLSLLHVAAEAGHADLVSCLLDICPGLATEVTDDG